MNNETRTMVKGWLAIHNGNVAALVSWMARTVRIGSLSECRALVREALE